MNHQAADNTGRAAITSLINEARAGNARAAADLLPLVYAPLRAMAARKMRQERPDQTLQATALVHEAYLRLVDDAGGGRSESRPRARDPSPPWTAVAASNSAQPVQVYAPHTHGIGEASADWWQ